VGFDLPLLCRCRSGAGLDAKLDEKKEEERRRRKEEDKFMQETMQPNTLV